MEIGTVTDKNGPGRRRSTVFSDRCPTVVEEMCCQYRLACFVVQKSYELSFVFALLLHISNIKNN